MKLQVNESQNIEFKQSWRDEYIKWLSAFGNSDGGKLYIGVDDDGNIIAACREIKHIPTFEQTNICF